MEKTLGMFKGKFFEEMTREELLDFVAWVGPEMDRLNKIARDTADYRIGEELKSRTT